MAHIGLSTLQGLAFGAEQWVQATHGPLGNAECWNEAGCPAPIR